MRGIIHYGINNIYSVKIGDQYLECRLKGKKLKTDTREYNPLSAGDIVEVVYDSNNTGKGMIISRIDRRNTFSRWNRKKGRIQTVAANIDLLVCIMSPKSPAFRPRFVDRVLVNSEDNFPVLLVMNKCDQNLDEEIHIRLEDWAAMGHDLIFTSALTGKGVPELIDYIRNKTAAFIGQSGVGKSSLLNAIEPGLNYRVGNVSEKFNKGTHTTCYAVLDNWEDGIIIDTPGIKEIDPVGIEPELLSHFMRDFRPYIGKCAHTVCMHREEPGCAVKNAVEKKEILPDRYDSYLRILGDLEDRIEANRYKRED